MTGSAQEPTLGDGSMEDSNHHQQHQMHSVDENFVRCPCTVNEVSSGNFTNPNS